MGRSFEVRKASMAKTQGVRVKINSKFGKEIYMCAKNGGIDPNGNLTLRRLMEKAKKEQVPTHVIDRALEKAQGGGGEDYHPARYEGFGPGGCMVIVDCLTDNNNRTIGDVRICFNKAKAKMGTPGSVSHMFDHQAVLVFKGDDEDAVLEALMMEDVDVTDIECEDGMITVFAPHTEFFKAKTAVINAFADVEFEIDEISFIPQTSTPLSGDDVPVFERFLEMLNDCEDVQQVYHNAEIAE
ncbi:MAG: YebC/PmpR family DNA-binding transcriptional regulator [Oceanospirillaceae bacterium]|nr:YebC/PmpR family DNA-binding transcriptional regulator [Oceanospirillaceae bacterium]